MDCQKHLEVLQKQLEKTKKVILESIEFKKKLEDEIDKTKADIKWSDYVKLSQHDDNYLRGDIIMDIYAISDNKVTYVAKCEGYLMFSFETNDKYLIYLMEFLGKHYSESYYPPVIEKYSERYCNVCFYQRLPEGQLFIKGSYRGDMVIADAKIYDPKIYLKRNQCKTCHSYLLECSICNEHIPRNSLAYVNDDIILCQNIRCQNKAGFIRIDEKMKVVVNMVNSLRYCQC